MTEERIKVIAKRPRGSGPQEAGEEAWDSVLDGWGVRGEPPSWPLWCFMAMILVPFLLWKAPSFDTSRVNPETRLGHVEREMTKLQADKIQALSVTVEQMHDAKQARLFCLGRALGGVDAVGDEQ